MILPIKVLWFYDHSDLIGKRKNDWQYYQYELRRFSESVSAARRSWVVYIAKDVALGRRKDPIGGELVHLLVRVPILKELRGGGLCINGDERISGSSNFVEGY